MAIDVIWGLDDLPAETLAFAEAVGTIYDPWEVVTPREAAAVAGCDVDAANVHIAALKPRKCWPYRGTKWRAVLAREGRIGPFGPRCGEWGRRAG